LLGGRGETHGGSSYSSKRAVVVEGESECPVAERRKTTTGSSHCPPARCNATTDSQLLGCCTALLCAALLRPADGPSLGAGKLLRPREASALPCPVPPRPRLVTRMMLLPCLATWTHWPSGRGVAWLWLGECGQALVFTSLLACYASTLPLLAVRRSRLGNEQRAPACDGDGGVAHLIRTVRNVAMLLCSRKQTNQAHLWCGCTQILVPLLGSSLLPSSINKTKKQKQKRHLHVCKTKGIMHSYYSALMHLKYISPVPMTGGGT
jgi:hypothetical protein